MMTIETLPKNARFQTKYDILTRMKQRGQNVLIELPRTQRKDRPHTHQIALVGKQHREAVAKEGGFYDYAKEHPELCPPVGTVIQIRSQYGVRAKLTVTMILGGLPGTIFELLPLSEQPEHLRNEALLAKHVMDCGRPGWTSWADSHAWRLWQEIKKAKRGGRKW